MQIDKELLKQVQQKYAAEEEPFMTGGYLGSRPGYEGYQQSELERLAQVQNQGRLAQFARSPGMQTAAAAGTGVLGGGAIGGLLGGKAGILPGSVLGGLAMTIARYFFKDDFNKALRWLSAVMNRDDAPEILEGVSKKLPEEERKKVQNVAAGIQKGTAVEPSPGTADTPPEPTAGERAAEAPGKEEGPMPSPDMAAAPKDDIGDNVPPAANISGGLLGLSVPTEGMTNWQRQKKQEELARLQAQAASSGKPEFGETMTREEAEQKRQAAQAAYEQRARQGQKAQEEEARRQEALAAKRERERKEREKKWEMQRQTSDVLTERLREQAERFGLEPAQYQKYRQAGAGSPAIRSAFRKARETGTPEAMSAFGRRLKVYKQKQEAARERKQRIEDIKRQLGKTSEPAAAAPE